MSASLNIEPTKDELPSKFADRLGIYYAHSVTTKHKKDNGQFFTPTEIAQLMASYCGLTRDKVRILDPGCGTAILTCALVEHLVKAYGNIKVIDLVAYETDPEIISYSQKSLTYLKQWLLEKDIKLQYLLHIHDFIKDNACALKENYNGEQFDLIISNPPYFKLAKDDGLKSISRRSQTEMFIVWRGV